LGFACPWSKLERGSPRARVGRLFGGYAQELRWRHRNSYVRGGLGGFCRQGRSSSRNFYSDAKRRASFALTEAPHGLAAGERSGSQARCDGDGGPNHRRMGAYFAAPVLNRTSNSPVLGGVSWQRPWTRCANAARALSRCALCGLMDQRTANPADRIIICRLGGSRDAGGACAAAEKLGSPLRIDRRGAATGCLDNIRFGRLAQCAGR